eukprot:00096.XXX_264_1943_1 [CDS] Oithona nana genome sequencing.
MRDAYYDLLRAMLKHQDQARIDKVYSLAIGAIKIKDHKKQKKAYKLLEEMCENKVGNVDGIGQGLLGSQTETMAPSQASRLKCLIHIIKSGIEGADNIKKDFLFKVIPEAILNIKAVNEKARANAYTLLVVIGETLINKYSSTTTPDDILKEYLKHVLAGLAGEPTMIHCTLKALAKIYYEFKDVFPDDLVELLLQNVSVLMTHSSREVVIPAVTFLHVFITTCPVMASAKFCEKIVQALCHMTEDCKRHCRLKTRYLLDRLVRKFGYDVVKGLVDKDDETTLKRLKNIKKIQLRKKNLDENEEDDDDEDNEFSVKKSANTMEDIIDDDDNSDEHDGQNNDFKGNKKSMRKKTYIAEHDEAIVDFLDASAAQNLRTSLPQASSQVNKSKQKKSGFEIAPDGRLLIEDSSDEEDAPAKKKDQGYVLDNDSDDNDEVNDFASLVNVRKRKRGTSVASGKMSEMSYKSGGTGIHRPLDANSKKNVKEFGSEFKAKKARGDMKRKGQPDPYAYVPLQRSALNRRKRAKFEGQFKGLVKAAQDGSVKGKKAKSLANKMKNVKLY